MKIAIINAHYSEILGGSEIQCHQIAKGLTELGMDVTYLAVGGYNNSSTFPYQICAVDKSAAAIVNACASLRPTVIYWRFNKNFLASVLQQVKPLQIKVVFSVSHIHDLEPFAYKPIPNLSVLSRVKRRLGHLIKGFQFQRAFKKLDGVICNNPTHLNLIQHPNKIYIPNSPFLEFTAFSWPKPYVAWVGNIKAHKHPELFIDLAKSLASTGVDFLMVGDIQQQAYEYLNTKSALPNNFHYLGAKEIFETNGIIKSSMFLVHTCEPEGFPNVFLQAWGFGKPVISLQFDPADLLKREQIGFHSRDYVQFVEDANQLIEDPTLRTQVGDRANAYLKEHFVKEENIKELISFLSSTLRK